MEPSISTSELTQLTNELISEIGSAWLEDHAPLPGRPELPLASWLRMTKDTNPEDRPNNEVSLQLGRLARDIAILREAEVFGSEDRIKQLTDDNRDKFYSTVQELSTASTYVRLGRTVQFIPEAEERKADLMVDEDVEVECKYKTNETDIDRRRYDLYELLGRRTQHAFEQTGSAPIIQIELSFRNEPTRANIAEIENLVREAVRPSGPFAFVRTHGDFFYNIRSSYSRHGSEVQLFLPQNLIDEYDLVSAESKVITENQGIRQENTSLIAIKCDVLQDRVKSLNKSLKDATKQFSRQKPAIIHVDVTSSIRELTAGHVPRSREVVTSFLRNNRSVSAVVFEHDQFYREEGRLVLSRSFQTILNEEARNLLPAALSDQLIN